MEIRPCTVARCVTEVRRHWPRTRARARVLTKGPHRPTPFLPHFIHPFFPSARARYVPRYPGRPLASPTSLHTLLAGATGPRFIITAFSLFNLPRRPPLLPADFHPGQQIITYPPFHGNFFFFFFFFFFVKIFFRHVDCIMVYYDLIYVILLLLLYKK